MDQHYCTIKISSSNNMQQIGHSIKLKSESIYMKFSSTSRTLEHWKTVNSATHTESNFSFYF
jgi:hypothetical protein